MKISRWKTCLGVTLFTIFPAHTLMAKDQTPATLSWGFLIIGLLGGLALFLYGMDKMSAGMKKSAGNQMRIILAALTKNRVIALLVGAFVTMVIQSSSATTVMLVSFVQAGLMGFTQTLGVILGADIGTTVTAQLIAFKLTDYALLMIAVGFGTYFFQAGRRGAVFLLDDEFYPRLSLIEGIDMREQKVNFLQQKITNYLLKISKQALSDEQSKEVFGMISIAKDMESLGDLIHRNMIPLVPKKQILESDFSSEGKEELLIYHEKVCKQIYLLREAFDERSPEKAQAIMASEKKYLDLESQYRIHHLERLRHERLESLETHSVHLELMDLMKQIIVYSSYIAKTFIESCGQGHAGHIKAELQNRSLLKGVDFLSGVIQKGK